ncbi:MAG TPA: SagB/ThcOx family dehydrogenase [Egibacteraceae bacterium]
MAEETLSAERVAAYANSYQEVSGWTRSTGFQTHGYRFSHLGDVPRSIGEQFLLATRYRRIDRETEASIASYFVDPGVVMLSRNGEEDVAGRRVEQLPEGVRLRRELGEVLGNRRSIRDYTGDAIPLPQLATVVRAAGACTAVGHVDLVEGGERSIPFRTAPSPGGLYPLEVWLLARRVEGLDAGVWRFDPRRDALVHEGDEAMEEAARGCFAVPEEVIALSRAAAVILLVARPWKVMRKYGDRGVRYLFIEAGAIAENIHLACGSLGLGSCDCASVHDDELHQALDFDGELRQLAHTVVIGVPA